MTTPTDLDGPPSGITFLRSTTSTTVDTDADGDTTTAVKHTARFAIRPGSVPDLVHHFGSQTFVPMFLTARWNDGKLFNVRVVGPRRLKSGKIAGHGDIDHDVNSREFEWSSYDIDRGTGWNNTPIPDAIIKRLADYPAPGSNA
jgi:hypothetical protein